MEKSTVRTPLKRARAESSDDEREDDFKPETLPLPRHGTAGEFAPYNSGRLLHCGPEVSYDVTCRIKTNIVIGYCFFSLNTVSMR
jgi:hypothetical protein